ncbi:GNAT family N-acetyltransferase [Pyrococcus abyssi]|nr:GNAT family N-acetyltransferase [Pyrococcus abyssi]
MKIREATLNDAQGITEVHISDVKIPRYEELSVEERYRYGGPWMSVETCAIHINNLLLHNHPVLVAEENGRILGELEMLISEEMFLGKIRKICHVNVLMVHKDYRGKGIGRALMIEAERVARERGCELITVTPEDRAVGFYKKLGYETLIKEKIFEVKTTKGNANVTKKKFSWEDVRRLDIVAGRFQSSYYHWFSNFVDVIHGIDTDRIIETGIVGKSYYILRRLPNGKGAVYVWGRYEDIPVILKRAGNYFQEIVTCSNIKLGRIIGENVILGKALCSGVAL